MKRFILSVVVAAVFATAWLVWRAGENEVSTSPLAALLQADDTRDDRTIESDLDRLGRTVGRVAGATTASSASRVGESESPRLDRSQPFATQRPGLEALAEAGDASAAVAMHLGLNHCRGAPVGDDAELLANAERAIDVQLQLSEAIIATIPEDDVRETGVDALAQVDPDEAIASAIEEAKALNRFCDGTMALDVYDHRVLADHWLERAAVLGDRAAMRTYVFRAFQTYGSFTSVAAEMARRKPVVLDVIARGLAGGDAYMLGEMAISIGRGHFAPADPERGYAYALAYLGVPGLSSEPALAAWFSDAELRARPYIAIVMLRTELEAVLDASARARAEALAPVLLSACCAGGSP